MTNDKVRPEYMEESKPPITESGDPRGLLMKCCFPGPAVFAWQGCDNCCHAFLACLCGCFFTFFCWTPAPRQKKFKRLRHEQQYCCCECNPLDCCCRFWCPFHAIFGHQGFDSILDTVVMLVMSAGSIGQGAGAWISLLIASMTYSAASVHDVYTTTPAPEGPHSPFGQEVTKVVVSTAVLFGAYHSFGCYACCCWVPLPTQKVWGKPMVGLPHRLRDEKGEARPVVGQAVAGQHQALPAPGGASEDPNYGSFLTLKSDE
eukprot:g10830.t1